MSLNLITDAWIPVRLRDGTSKDIRPADILDFGPDGDNPPVELYAARPDFNGALIQFLIGLLQTFVAPADEDEWWEWFESPPAPDELHERLSKYSEAFKLFGEFSFMQDTEELPPRFESDLFDLLLDSPSGNTKNNNKDIFNKRVESCPTCSRCAALTVMAMQANATSGGAGHRTSIRGGGPSTTVLSSETLWQSSWLNVLPYEAWTGFEEPSTANLEKILPWMAPTRTSEKKTGVETLPSDAHPAQLFWATPRRIQLIEPSVGTEKTCSHCGAQSEELCRTFRMKNYGVNYTGPWIHPLTPYSFDSSNDPNPLKGSQEGFAYKNWRGIVMRDEENDRRPAKAVEHFRHRRERFFSEDYPNLQVRIWAFGYDADKAKICSWQDGLMPLVVVPDDKRKALDQFAAQLIDGAAQAEKSLRFALKRGLYGTVKEVTSTGKKKWKYDDRASYDKSLFVQASTQFWRDTEADFYRLLGQSPSALDDRRALDELKRRWAKTLRDASIALFDRITGYGNFHNANPKSLALARSSMRWFFNPNNGAIRKALQLMDPATQEQTSD
jgi:CRISPR system Cascade subunit CasA